jgi:hypothetical protein
MMRQEPLGLPLPVKDDDAMRQHPSWYRIIVQFKCSCGMTKDGWPLLFAFCSTRAKRPLAYARPGLFGAAVEDASKGV